MRKVSGKKKETQNGENEGLEASEIENEAEVDQLAENDDEEPNGDADDKDFETSDVEKNDVISSDDEPLTSSKKKTSAKVKKGPKKGAKKGASGRGRPKKQKPEEDDEEYEVKEIIDHKYVGKKLLYQIRWKGYSADEDTWEPKDSLNCPEIIKKYEETNDTSAASSKKGGNKRKSANASKQSAKRSKDDIEEEDDEENEGKEYEVQRIIDVHNKKNGKREFLVRWKGWSSQHDTWEPEENLNCKDLIKTFEAKVNQAKVSTQKDLRVAPKATKRFVAANISGKTRHSKRGTGRQRVTYFDE